MIQNIIIGIVSISNTTPHPTRSYPLVIPLTILSAAGLVFLYQWIRSQKKVRRRFFLFLSGGFILYCLAFFFSSYFLRFPVLYADKWRSPEKELTMYVSLKLNKEQSNDAIIIDSRLNIAYTSLLFYQRYDPVLFQADSTYIADGQLIRLEKAGSYEIRSVDWGKDMKEGTLIVSHPDYASESYIPKKIWYYPQRPVVLFFDNQIAQYPTQDVAFAIYQFPEE